VRVQAPPRKLVNCHPAQGALGALVLRRVQREQQLQTKSVKAKGVGRRLFQVPARPYSRLALGPRAMAEHEGKPRDRGYLSQFAVPRTWNISPLHLFTSRPRQGTNGGDDGLEQSRGELEAAQGEVKEGPD
jgi:hypothetical protein